MPSTHQHSPIARRNVVHTAAWSVPAITLAAAAPTLAASAAPPVSVSDLSALYYHRNVDPLRDLTLFFGFDTEIQGDEPVQISTSSDVPGIGERTYNLSPLVAGISANFPVPDTSATQMWVWWEGIMLGTVQIDPYTPG